MCAIFQNQHKPSRQNYRRDYTREHDKHDKNQATYNIKVEFTTESGERTCTVDKNNPLPPINVKDNKIGRKTYQKNLHKPK